MIDRRRRCSRVQPQGPRRLAAGAATAALLAFPLSSCSLFGGGSAPEPVAVVQSVTGVTTAIKLDKRFIDALKSLELTPGVVGSAKLTDGSLVFPITGGNVTVFEPGEVSPYVVGQIQHESSGLSLTAGGNQGQHRGPRGHQGQDLGRRGPAAERHLQDRRRQARVGGRHREDHRQDQLASGRDRFGNGSVLDTFK